MPSDADLVEAGVTPLNAMLVRQGAAAQSIDLAEKFGAGYTFTVASSNGAAVDATVDADGVLTLEYGALGHSDLRIVATDTASGETISDDFRVRVAGENAYTIAVMPDTQDYTSNAGITNIFGEMTQWLVDNKDSLNIQFVTHVGDVTQWNSTAQWAIAEEALRKLDGKIPYSILPGNHDLSSGGSAADRSEDNLSDYFPVAEQSQLPGFGGVYDKEPESFNNNYFTFTAPDGTKWLSLSLEFGPRDDVLRWAGDVIEDNLDHRVMITTHGYMAGDGRVGPVTEQLTGENAGPSYGVGNDVRGSADGDGVWEKLASKYPNVAFTFSGHNFIDGGETQVDYGAGGQAVMQMIVNYQNGISREITGNGNEAIGSNGGNGAMRLVTIDPENDAVYTDTYFSNLDDYLDGFRGKAELDRDGLTGPYRGHQEAFDDVDLSAPAQTAFAKAGHDLFVEAADGDVAAVTLDGSGTIVPQGQDATYAWKDSDGQVIATGIDPTVDLGVGSHALTLEVTGAGGVVSRDELRVVVSGESTLLTDNFNDGNTDGWSVPTAGGPLIEFGSPEELGLPAMPGGDGDGVIAFPHFSDQQGLALTTNATSPTGDGLLHSYSIVMDVLLPDEGAWTSLFQTDLTNNSDAEFYLRNDGDGTGSLGISSNYQGDFQYGEWQRIGFTFERQGTSDTVLIKKFIDGEFVGQQTDSGGRFKIDAADGIMLFTDDDADTTSGNVSSVLFSDRVLAETELAGFGAADGNGIASDAIAGASQFDFTDGKFSPTFGSGSMSLVSGPAGASPLKVVGTVNSGEPADAAEGTLKDLTNNGTNVLVWNGAGARQWDNYVYDLTLNTTDNSGKIGVVFGYQDAENHYRLTFDINGNARQLVKVQDGVETVLETVARGIPMDTDLDVRVAMVNGEIRAFVDGHDIFDGAVVDADPLGRGTVGLYTQTQDVAAFDNVIVNEAALTAHGASAARAIDTDGDGVAQVELTASGSFGPDEITQYRWLLDGMEVGTGETATVDVPVGTLGLTLEVTDETGAVATDWVAIETSAQGDVLLGDDFTAIGADWRFVNEGETATGEPTPIEATWRIEDGRLVQDADVSSRQLTNGWNASSSNVWDRGWSPLGDGDYILRRGAYAVYEGEGAQDWKDYSLEVTLNGGGNDAMGLMFYYQDPENYYKLELDNTYGLYQLTRVVDGIESIVARTAGRYALDADTRVRVDVKDHVIDVMIDGERIFERPIEDRNHDGGTFALYNWGADGGVSYDDVSVVSLSGAAAIVGTAGDDLLDGTADADVVRGLAGDDTLNGRAGDDTLDGSTGDDVLRGGDGTDELIGGRGHDTLAGGDGDDLVAAGAGNDNVNGGAGDDIVLGAAGDDTVGGGAGDDFIFAGGGDDVAHGGAGGDRIVGGKGDDTIDGDAGDDILFGRDGDDLLVGDTGRDRLDGGTGDDTLTGGKDRDAFLFGADFGHDVVTDFTTEGANRDVVKFAEGLFDDFEDLLGHAEQVERDVVIELDADNTLTLENIRLASLVDDDFRFVA